MGKFVNSILFLGGILAIGLVLSGYKESFALMPTNYPSDLAKSILGGKVKKEEELCRPGFECRRVNFYCSN